MKVKVTLNGKTADIDIPDEKLEELGLKEEKKKTGYERVGLNRDYWYVTADGSVISDTETLGINVMYANDRADEANYYSDEDLAVANARADKLMRQLRRFAAENGGIPSVADWKNHLIAGWYIHYEHFDDGSELVVDSAINMQRFGCVYFSTREGALKAIELYHDELIWYFTEYEAMLR